MKRILTALFCCALALSAYAQEEQLFVEWEALTAPDFAKAVEKSEGVCIVPMGVLEKHGPHLPLGTDVLNGHGLAVLAAQQEYCVVFPFYYVGQINEARHQPGTLSYSPDLVYKMLEETCEEIARNGFKKIILYSYHGGNKAFLEYFCFNQLHSKKDYVVYQALPSNTPETQAKIDKMRTSAPGDHAEELETATVMCLTNYAKVERANDESGENLDRLTVNKLRPGIWWYASYPNHYAGNSIGATKELGEVVIDGRVEVMVQMIKDVKADTVSPALQAEFFERAEHPLDEYKKK